MVLGFLGKLKIFLTVGTGRFDRDLNNSWATRAVALDISKAFDSI